CVCALLVLRGFAQAEALQVQDTTMMPDTIEHTKVEEHSKDSSGVRPTEFVRSTKIRFDELHLLDLGTQPISIGEKEYRRPSLGQRWETEFLPLPRKANGAIAASFGNYTTPTFSGWWGGSAPESEVLGRAFYSSSKGDKQYRDYQKGHASLAAAWVLPESSGVFSSGTLRSEVALSGSHYRLFGSLTPSQARTLTQFRAEASLEARGARESTRRAFLRLSRTRMDDHSRAEETTLTTELGVGAYAGEFFVTGTLKVLKDFTEMPGVQKENPLYTVLETDVRYRVDEQVEISAGGELYYLRYSGSEHVWRAVPRARIAYRAARSIRLFAEYQPSVVRNSVSEFAEDNPYVHNSIVVRQTDMGTDVRIGCSVDAENVLKVQALLGYQRVHSYPVYVPSPERLWQVAYTGTSPILWFQSDVYVEAGTAVIGASFHVKKTEREAGSNKDIPYLPRVSFTATIEQRIARTFRVSSDVRYTGGRFADLDNTRRLPAAFHWDIAAEFGEDFLVGAGVTNLLGTRDGAWEWYEGEPRRVYLSLGYVW
ncbi:MAG TPA: hypothetical protein VNL69_12765, partial [Bacteroidota bacterium]|nr:hypothetical protein [Bacteroidota bacterium]